MICTYSGWPGKIVCGAGAAKTIADEVKALGGNHIILFSDPGLTSLDIVKEVIAEVSRRGVVCTLFDRIGPNPTDDMVRVGVLEMQCVRPDCIVSIGGGSPTDCAKACNVVYTHGGLPQEYDVGAGGIEKIQPKLLPFIAVPTTAGTGSEVTDVSVITDAARHVKFGIKSPLLIPRTAILDPVLTCGLGKNTTAFTGIDALTHCIESYVSVVDFICADAQALYGIRTIKKYLPIAWADGGNIEAREKMLLASMMAGASFNINNLGLCHQMAHQLSSYFGLPHGLANAILLPHVMRFNLDARPERFAEIAEALGCDVTGLSYREAGLLGIETVEGFCAQLGVPKYLDEVGVTRDLVSEMAVTALQDGVGATNPVTTTVQECEELYYECFSK